jgi:hypothetical protein
MAALHQIRIFLSSPGDVPQERALALQVIDQLNYDPFLRDKVSLQPIAWDKPGAGTPMIATMTPQEAINQGLPRPSECDIVIVIFWSRMGTPLPADYKKADGSRYLSGTEWEFVDAIHAAHASTANPARPQVVVYRRTEKVAFDPDDLQFDSKTEQWRRVKAFFNNFSAPDGSILRGYNQYDTPEKFRLEIETHLRKLVKRLMESPIQQPTVKAEPTLKNWIGSPFPGLRAFTPDDADIFFGRGAETDRLIERMKNNRLVVVVGASGSGKSSLVGAGVLPRLKKYAIDGSIGWIIPERRDEGTKRAWSGLRFTPGEMGHKSNPFLALADHLAPMLDCPKGELADALNQEPKSIVTLCDPLFENQPEWAEVLLFIDQFEELFTQADPQYIPAFIAMLDAVANSGRLRAILTMRADFYAQVVKYPDLTNLFKDSTFPLSAPTLAELYEMIDRPSIRAGLHFEDGLVTRILNDTGTTPGSLALMAFALDELYQRSDKSHLTFKIYEALGGVQGAISERAEKVYTDYAQKEPTAEETFFSVSGKLVEIDDRGEATRRRVLMAIAAHNPAAHRLIDDLTAARLLVQSENTDHQPMVEVAHEALLRNWPRLVNYIAQIEENLKLRRQVEYAAKVWHEALKNVIRKRLTSPEERQELDRRFAAPGWFDDLQASLAANLITAEEIDAIGRLYLWPQERLQPIIDLYNADSEPVLEPVKSFLEPEIRRILRELDREALTHKERESSGQRVAEIRQKRDPHDVLLYRFTIGTEDLKRLGIGSQSEGVPLVDWSSQILGGTSTIRIRNTDQNAIVNWEPFFMARFPVTNEHYIMFLNAEDGYKLDKWWISRTRPVPNISDDMLKKPNYPITNVTWNAAVAYCAWLTHQYRQVGLLSAQEEIRLPYEWEWLYAMRGDDPSRTFPWGAAFDSRYCNTAESRIGHSVAVGLYPKNRSPFQVWDMFGNVAEWCYNADSETSFKLIDPANSVPLVTCGSSFKRAENQGYRRIEKSTFSDTTIGFRVIWASVLSKD